MTLYDFGWWSWVALVLGDFVGRPLLHRWRHRRALREERQFFLDEIEAANRRYMPPDDISGPHR